MLHAIGDLTRMTALTAALQGNSSDHIGQTGNPNPGDTELLSGIQAVVKVAAEQHKVDAAAGLRTGALFSGYPGSPLAGLDLLLERGSSTGRSDFLKHVPAVNEELGAAAVWGTQLPDLLDRSRYDGVVGYWYGKSPGVDRSGDVFRHAQSMGVAAHGGVLAIVGDDPTAKSSTLPSDSQGTLTDLQFPILAPSSIGEVLEYGLHGIALSRFCGLWVAMKVVTDLADGFAAVRIADYVPAPILPAVKFDGRPWEYRQAVTVNNVTSSAEEGEIFYHRLAAARAYCTANDLNKTIAGAPAARTGLVIVGRAAANTLQALEGIGLGKDGLSAGSLRVLKIGMPYPLEPEAIREFARGLDQVVVVEEKRPLVEAAIQSALYSGSHRPRIIGKFDDAGHAVIPADGELSPDRLMPILARQLAPLLPDGLVRQPRGQLTVRPLLPIAGGVPPRLPAFCSGCPHNRSTASIEGAVVGGGVGCHAIVYLEDRHRDDVILPLTSMGAEGALWLGSSPYSDKNHVFQNLGDGTLSHSGSLAIRASIAAGVNVTYKILFNSAVAMTGGQDVTGQTTVPALTRELDAMGAARIVVCADDPRKYGRHARWAKGITVWSRDELHRAERELAAHPGTTILIYDQRCAAEARRLWRGGELREPRTRVVINQAVCEGCGDCQVKSNCLSVRTVDTPLGSKTEIHQPSCNHDLSCLDGDCPSFVTVQTASVRNVRRAPILPPGLPVPELPEVGSAFSAYMVGIGGTGVVTANRLLAHVAMREGWLVSGLDQTGLSQKAGAVTSHLRLSRTAEPLTNLVSDHSCDVFFAFDILSASQPKNLQRIDSAHTAVVATAGIVPTASMISGSNTSPPVLDVLDRLRLSAARVITCDANGATRDLFDDDMPANVFALGFAFQSGLLPFSLQAFEASIRDAAPAADTNLSAFHWGRVAAERPEELSAAKPASGGDWAPPAHSRRAEQAGERLLAQSRLSGASLDAASWRVKDLVDYQDERLARRYLQAVERVAEAETSVIRDSTDLSQAVAFGYYKLLAYKDEYEVARLHLNKSFQDTMRQETGIASPRFLLHPPTLRALGRKKKIAFRRPTIIPAFKLLRALRGLRGTKLDGFGYAHVRRVERGLITEYETWLARLVDDLTSERYPVAVRLMKLPDEVRGYEEVKLRSIERYHEQASNLLRELGFAGR